MIILMMVFSDKLNNQDSSHQADFLGFILVNFTLVASFRQLVCLNHLKYVFSMVHCHRHPRRQLSAVDILRNLCFEDGTLYFLLTKHNAPIFTESLLISASIRWFQVIFRASAFHRRFNVQSLLASLVQILDTNTNCYIDIGVNLQPAPR